jgi:hypothetical protein
MAKRREPTMYLSVDDVRESKVQELLTNGAINEEIRKYVLAHDGKIPEALRVHLALNKDGDVAMQIFGQGKCIGYADDNTNVKNKQV